MSTSESTCWTVMRAFLYGVIRNVARQFESRPVRTADSLPEIAADDASQSRLFDRTWAQAIMAEVARSQRQRAAEGAATVGVGVDGLPDTCPYDGCPRPVNGCHVLYSLG
jgi:hypothetical protein